MYFRVKTKQKRKSQREIRGFILILLSFIIGYCLVLPLQSGAIGQGLARILFLFSGKAAFLIPGLLMWWGISLLISTWEIHLRLDMIWSMLLVLSGSSFVSQFGNKFYNLNYGGWLGKKISPFFSRLFGQNIALIITAGIFIYILSLLFRFSIKQFIIVVWFKLKEDYKQWQAARSEWKRLHPPKIKTPKTEPVKNGKRNEVEQPELKEEPKILTPQKPVIPEIKKPSKQEQETKPPKEKIKTQKTEPKPEQIVSEGEQPKKEIINYTLPSIDFLATEKNVVVEQSHSEHLANAELLTKTLADFNISAVVKEIIPGPVVTRYDIELAPGIKIQTVIALSDNIALTMRSPSVRVVSVPEKSAVGIEVPNPKGRIVGLKGIITNTDFMETKSLLSLAIGRTTDGAPYVANLESMPHLLIAGATGSGKSVCIHSIVLSLLYKARPDEVKLMLIDPKRLEMPIYKGLPHLYDPRVSHDNVDIITQPKEAADSLKKLVKVMEMRYEKFAKETVRNIESYNEKMVETGRPKEHYIIVIIDELADLILLATKDVEDSIQRLAQMARAVGIHLILATQRPSVDVITGVIKANFPARIAFQTTSKVDSRVILDFIGAEDLLGKGDMLFLPPGESRPIRLQGAFVSVKEAEKVVKFIKQQNVEPDYEDLLIKKGSNGMVFEDNENAEELTKALQLVQERKRVSQDLLKAHFGSSARATNILSLLETKGFIHKPEGTNRWSIHFDKIEEYLGNN